MASLPWALERLQNGEVNRLAGARGSDWGSDFPLHLWGATAKRGREMGKNSHDGRTEKGFSIRYGNVVFCRILRLTLFFLSARLPNLAAGGSRKGAV